VRVIRVEEFFENRPALRLGRLIEYADELSSIPVSNAGVSIGYTRFAGGLQFTLVGRHRLSETVWCRSCLAFEELVERFEFDGVRSVIRFFRWSRVFCIR